ncbi:7TM diverse intracellular signaling domain-containing protein [Rhizobacter sp. P5_C2]
MKFPTLVAWIAGLLCLLAGPAFAQATLSPIEPLELTRSGQFYLAEANEEPPDVDRLADWLARKTPVAHVSLLGGRYWFHATVRNDSPATQWVIDPHASLMEHVGGWVYVGGQPPQTFVTGYHADTPYMLHYGSDITLPRGSSAHVLLRIDSRYFARLPGIDIQTKADYRRTVISENVLALFALGALLTLALYNVFMFLGTRDKALLYYALYLLAATAGWGLTFHIPAQWLGWHGLQWHYLPFFLMVVFNTLFYIEFLQLREAAPRLAWLGYANLVLALVLLPSCFIAMSWAHTLATITISISLTLALVAGLLRLWSGYLPARYFLAAFLALLLPALVILPANLGLSQDMVRNPELIALLGSTADAILLAFALADKIRLLSIEKDGYLVQLHRALDQASTDALTGIGNRHAFDRALSSLTAADSSAGLMLVMIDLDGLKRLNDEHGHAHGDALLCEFSRQLQTLRDRDMTVFRLGGDEFAVLGDMRHEDETRRDMRRFEERLHAAGFEGCGISFGIAFGSEITSSSQLLIHADARMYRHKSTKRDAPESAAQAFNPRRA